MTERKDTYSPNLNRSTTLSMKDFFSVVEVVASEDEELVVSSFLTEEIL